MTSNAAIDYLESLYLKADPTGEWQGLAKAVDTIASDGSTVLQYITENATRAFPNDSYSSTAFAVLESAAPSAMEQSIKRGLFDLTINIVASSQTDISAKLAKELSTNKLDIQLIDYGSANIIATYFGGQPLNPGMTYFSIRVTVYNQQLPCCD